MVGGCNSNSTTRAWKCISRQSQRPKAKVRTCFRSEFGGTQKQSVTNRSIERSKIFSAKCPRWRLRSRRFIYERHCPTCGCHGSPSASEGFRLERDEVARSLRTPLQGNDGPRSLDARSDGPGRGAASTDHRHDYGFGARIAADACDSRRIFAHFALAAFFNLCAVQPSRLGTLLLDPRSGHARQGIFLFLDEMVVDRSFSRD